MSENINTLRRWPRNGEMSEMTHDVTMTYKVITLTHGLWVKGDEDALSPASESKGMRTPLARPLVIGAYSAVGSTL